MVEAEPFLAGSDGCTLDPPDDVPADDRAVLEAMA